MESIRRIQQDGSSKPLLELVKRRRTQKLRIECVKKDRERACVSLLNHDGLCWYEGIIEMSASVIVELCLNRVIEVVIASHTLLKVNGEEEKDIKSNQVLDLSDDGERWEGDVLNNQPYGWGVLYDSEGEKKYEGFMMGEAYVCYGTRYYSDIQKMEYEGEWCEGKRWGRGVQYDRNGNIVFDGGWMNDDNRIEKRVTLSEENQCLSNRIEELIMQDKSCNGREWKVLDFSFLVNLRFLGVGDECFASVEIVKLIGLKQLERVVIGMSSFTLFRTDWPEYSDPNRHFQLKNCERVRELKIGCWSFSDYSVCEIENVPSLEVIEMGEWYDVSICFFWSSLELKSDSQGKK